MIRITNRPICVFCCLLAVLLLLSVKANANIFKFNPVLRTNLLYDSNIDFNRDGVDKLEDFAYTVRPELSLILDTTLLTMSVSGILDFLRYFEESDFNRTNQIYSFDAAYRASERLTFSGGYNYTIDETIDSRFLEIGRVNEREERVSQRARGGIDLELTELTKIAPNISYRRVDYDENSGSIDYDRYTIDIPVSTLISQKDRLSLTPAFSYLINEIDEKARNYSLSIGWSRDYSERFSFDLNVGGRYTETEDADGDVDSVSGGIALFALNGKTETFNGRTFFSNNIRVDADAELINVSRLYVFGDQLLSERFGFRFSGNVFFSTKIRDEDEDDDVFSFDVYPSIYFKLTEHHDIAASYSYLYQKEFDQPGEPQTQRHAAVITLNLRFPQQYDF